MTTTKTKHDHVVDQLDQFYAQAKRQILQNQSAITGLFPSNSAEKTSASIKTSLWAASSIFALYLAYSKRVDNDKGKAHDLGQSVVKCMRGILFAWMRQSKQVELFKANQSPKHALHLKFDLHSGLANDFDYPHLQIDVVSLYLIFLANFIASGLDIIYCMDEVTFIQNLVYYVERAYRTPDYGNWEPTSEPRVKSPEQQQHQQQHKSSSGIGPLPAGAPLIQPAHSHHLNPQQQQQHYQQQQHHHHQNLHHPNEPINYHNYPAAASSHHQHHQHHHSTTTNQYQQQHQHHQHQQYSSTDEQQLSHDGRSLEIHATSIGMAKSALEAINGCNLFGGKGANWSIIYSDIDAHSRNRSIFETLLPRESRSKNTDSYLLATISWPCFATHDPVLYQSTKSKILRKLKGKYGLKRFLRDPYGTALDPELVAVAAATAAGLSPAHKNTASGGGGGGSATTSISTTTIVNNNCAHQATLAAAAASSASASATPTPTTTPPTPLIKSDSLGKESSFSSTTTNCSGMSSSLFLAGEGEPPKTKQRKSSYFQRKNIHRGAGGLQAAAGCSSQATDGSGGGGGSSIGGQLLQRMESCNRMSKQFEHIESEWPLFVCFLIIDGIFKQDMEQVYENEKLLYERLLKVDPKYGDYLMPKYYYVPMELINSEKVHPDSVERLPSPEGSSADQLYLTGQAILLIARLLLAGLVHSNELDPLRRHMPSHDRPKRIGRYSSFQATSSDLVVQTVLIAESMRLQAMMANYGIQTQTPLEVEPVQIWSSAQLVKVYEYLGVNEKLGLKGRPARPIGALGTSKLYRICGQTILCYPLIFEVSDFYLAQDMLLLIDDIQNELNVIGRYWRMSGRPTVCILIREEHLRDYHFRDLLDLLVQFKNGQLKKSGLRIKTGRLQNLISSSCIEHLDFLHLLPHEHLPQFKSFKQLVDSPKQSLLNMCGSGGRRATGGGGDDDRREGDHSMLANRRRHLCSSSSHNLKAIEEQSAAAQANCQGSGSAAETQHNDSLEDIYDSLDYDPAPAGDGTGPNKLGGALATQELEPQDYATISCNSIDYYESYKEAPTWPTLIELLRTCQEPRGQSQLLAILVEREGGKYLVDDVSVETRLERLSQEACQVRNWSVVRYCSAVLKRSVESLSPWLTSILVNGKQISLGSGANEKIISNPLTPTEILTLIYSTVSTKNPCDAVLQQEIALYIGRLISTRPDYFEGILTIRVANFMSAMRSYLNIKTNEMKQRQQQELLATTAAAQTGVVGTASLALPTVGSNDKCEPETTTTTTTTTGASLSSLRKAAAGFQQQQQSAAFEQQQQLLDLRIKPDPLPSTLVGGASGVETTARPIFELGQSTTTTAHNNHDNHPHAGFLGRPHQIKVEPPTPPLAASSTSSGAQPASGGGGFHRGHHRRSTRGLGQNLVAKPLESLSPSDVRKLLVKVLNTDDQSMPISDRRQITGELCRVPKDFYDKVWSLLGCTNVGIVIGGKTLRSTPILTNMTQDDLNFALKVESLLSAIDCPKLRQVNVELLMALHVILERNPEIRFESDPLDLDKIISLSLDKFRADFGREDYGLREFYTHSTQTTMLYTLRTVFDCLLPVKYKGRAECRLS